MIAASMAEHLNRFRCLSRRWVLALLLLSVVGLYSVEWLPHHHDAIGGQANCPICHAVVKLQGFSADLGAPEVGALAPVLVLLLLLTWSRPVSAPSRRLHVLPPSRAPPLSLSLL